MNISLTAELEARIRAKVDSGLYNNASEVIREALRFMDTHEEWIYQIKLEKLRHELAVGIKQLDQGQGIAIGNDKERKRFLEGIRAAAKDDKET